VNALELVLASVLEHQSGTDCVVFTADETSTSDRHLPPPDMLPSGRSLRRAETELYVDDGSTLMVTPLEELSD
jgi:hypothetical protein